MDLFSWFAIPSKKKVQKRRAEEIFLTKDDVYTKLQDQCTLGATQKTLDALRQGFRGSVAMVASEQSEPCYWTSQTLAALVDEETNRMPSGSEAVDILWELLQAWATFPFPPSDQANALDIPQCMYAFALLRSGRRVMRKPYYRSGPRVSPRDEQHRTRGPIEEARFIFQALADMPPDEETQAESPMLHQDRSNDVDLVDAMACGLDIEEDIIRWNLDDFDKAVAQLPSSHSRRKLDWQLSQGKYALLVQLVDSIREAGRDRNAQIDAAEGSDATKSMQASADISWPDFLKETEQCRPDMYELLRRYLLHALASVHEERQGIRFVYKRPANPSPWPRLVYNADGTLRS